MNLSYLQTLRYDVVPQAWKVMLPPAFSFFVLFSKVTEDKVLPEIEQAKGAEDLTLHRSRDELRAALDETVFST